MHCIGLLARAFGDLCKKSVLNRLNRLHAASVSLSEDSGVPLTGDVSPLLPSVGRDKVIKQ